MSLKEILKTAEAGRYAIGHFNISDFSGLKGIVAAARELDVPVIIGTSEGEREFLGEKQAAALIASFREEGVKIFLNADHTHSLEKVKRAVEAGYDAILFDGGKLPLEENIARTREVVEYVRSANPRVIVEGELGYIGSGSVILKEIPAGAALRPEDLTTPEEAVRFVEETGVDMLAPAVGNFHGLLAHGQKPRLNIERIAALKQAVNIPFVLHGGSGQADEDFVAAIQAGISVVHINTELRKAWRSGLERGLAADPDEVTPAKILAPAVEAVKENVKARLLLYAARKQE